MNISPEDMSLQAPRTIDVLNRETPYLEALDFIHGCNVLASVMRKENPDIVFFPQRGASPIAWTTEVLLKNNGISQPLFIDLPIGTHLKINEQDMPLGGVSRSEKQALIDESLGELQEKGLYIPGASRLMLVDEVQKGGTITQAASALKKSMAVRDDKALLRVVAFQDSRYDLLGAQRKPQYADLASNQQDGFKTIVIPLTMFMVDKLSFLDEVYKTFENSGPFLDNYVTNENIDARKIFQTLAEVYSNPRTALEELEEIRRQNLADSVGRTGLKHLLLDAITSPGLPSDKRRASDRQIIAWWTNFAKKSETIS